MITVCHHSANFVMPNSDLRDRIFDLTLMMGSYIIGGLWGNDIRISIMEKIKDKFSFNEINNNKMTQTITKLEK